MNAIKKMYPTIKTATLSLMGDYSMTIAIIEEDWDSKQQVMYCYNPDTIDSIIEIADINLFTDTENILNQGINTLHNGFKTEEGEIYFIDQFCRNNI